MPIEVYRKTTTRAEGTGRQISFTILCIGRKNEDQTDEIPVDGLVKVGFKFIQIHDGDTIQTQYIAKKIHKDCTVKIKVNNFAEKICLDEPNWEVIDDIYAETRYIENWRSESQNDAFAFHLNVTINAFKVSATFNKKLFDDTEFTDFQLTTSDGSLPVHKAYLAAHSEVFKAMLHREWKETNEGRIQMSGVSLQTLQHLKDYMYMGTLPTDGLLPLLSIASCYMIEELRNQCITKLTQIIKPENLYEILEYSFENKIPELTFAIMKATPESVLATAEKALFEKRSKEEIKEE